MNGRIIVFLEGKKKEGLKKSARALLKAAWLLSQQTGKPVEAVLMGEDPKQYGEEVLRKGLNCIHYVKSAALKDYDVHQYAPAFFSVVKDLNPWVIMGNSTLVGKDLFPRVAAMFSVPMISDCQKITFEGPGLKVVKACFYGKKQAELSFTGNLPYIVTLVPNSAEVEIEGQEAAVAEETKEREIEYIADEKPKGRLVEIIMKETEKQDVLEAEAIVAGGRALKEKADFLLLEELAEKLDAAVGASRAVVDSDLASPEMQIGQSGKTVAPKLYFALGISGAAQHIAGMRGSKVVVAVNKDKQAPVFDYAQYGIVGDVYQIVPEIIKALTDLDG